MDSWAATHRALLDSEVESEDACELSLVELVLVAAECTEDEFELSDMVQGAVDGRAIRL